MKVSIEDTIPLFNIDMKVKSSFDPRRVYLAPQGQEIEFKQLGSFVNFTIPSIYGHQMVVIEK